MQLGNVTPNHISFIDDEYKPLLEISSYITLSLFTSTETSKYNLSSDSFIKGSKIKLCKFGANSSALILLKSLCMKLLIFEFPS